MYKNMSIDTFWNIFKEILNEYYRGFYFNSLSIIEYKLKDTTNNFKDWEKEILESIKIFISSWELNKFMKIMEKREKTESQEKENLSLESVKDFYYFLTAGWMCSIERMNYSFLLKGIRYLNQAGRVWSLCYSRNTSILLKGFWSVYWFRGIAYMNLNMQEKAGEDFERANRYLEEYAIYSTINYRPIIDDKILVARFKHDYGNFLFSIGKMFDAKKMMREALNLDNDNPYIHIDYTIILFTLGEEYEAIDNLEKAYVLAEFEEKKNQIQEFFMTGKIFYHLGNLAYRYYYYKKGIFSLFEDKRTGDSNDREKQFIKKLNLARKRVKKLFLPVNKRESFQLFNKSFRNYVVIKDAFRAYISLLNYCDPLKDIKINNEKKISDINVESICKKIYYELSSGTDFIDDQAQLQNQIIGYIVPESEK